MKNPKSYLQFINAVRTKGGLRHYDLGGGVAPGAVNLNNSGGLGSIGQANGGLNGSLPFPGAPVWTANPNISYQPAQNTTQGGLAGSLTPQNTYGAYLAPQQYSNYQPYAGQAIGNALGAQGQYQGNLSAEQALASQYGNIAAGGGPNPAQAALAQSTQANVANQAALAAGQRGAASNVGLMARQNAQQGAATQQQAAGQAATMQAQQELGAMQAQAGLQGQMGQQIAGQMGQNTALAGTLTGAQAAQNQASIANYAQMQGVNAAAAAQNAQNTANTVGAIAGAGSSLAAAGMGGGGGGPSATDISQSNINTPYLPGQAQGGLITKGMADGGMASMGNGGGYGGDVPGADPASGTNDFMTQINNHLGNDYFTPASGASGGGGGGGSGLGTALSVLGTAAAFLGCGGPVSGELLAAQGKKVPGTPKVTGDSKKNDTVPAMLSPGEIVLPRTIANAPDAPRRAASFVQAVQAKQGLKRGLRH